jgi:hypothetical protein
MSIETAMVTRKVPHGNSEAHKMTYFITGYILLEGTNMVYLINLYTI